ncbi:hypothetical protein Q667_00695 [Marinobacter sp. C1S70]|uniref:DUF488 domain-containing protein n=1 Tax=Marinobacter sp. C1S70 TaxID=1396859 RepID=UPI0003B84E39|nr:DUF488 domain-containing protein [Marinobacter sp. C1S70]ERS90967.1 hypothetical protein Q667_00695 [Marinobacter sp. C1S70]
MKARLKDTISRLGGFYGHPPETSLRPRCPLRWPGFRDRYFKELKSDEAAEDLDLFRQILKEHKRVTLVFAAKDTDHNNAVALRDFALSDQL